MPDLPQENGVERPVPADAGKNELVSVDVIIDYLKNVVENKIPIPPATWLDAALKLTVLLSDLDEDLIDAKCRLAELKSSLIAMPDSSASRAKIDAEASPEYRTFLLLEAKRDRVIEFIRIAKKRVELKDWE